MPGTCTRGSEMRICENAGFVLAGWGGSTDFDFKTLKLMILKRGCDVCVCLSDFSNFQMVIKVCLKK